MYTARRTELGKLHAYDRELTGMYAEAVLRKHFDQAQTLFDQRRSVRRAILNAQEWAGDDGVVVQLPRHLQVQEDLARAA
jgi:hypothetical protein